MRTVELILLALALSADAFTASAAIALNHNGRRGAFRISFHFGLFQMLLALAGALAGTVVLDLIREWDHWFVLILLGWIGGRMTVNGLRGNRNDERLNVDLTRGWTLVGLSIAVSIDAFAAGISLPTMQYSLFTAAAVIGIVSAGNSILGWRLARRLSSRWHRGVEVVGGLILIAIGVNTLISHLKG